MVVRTWGTDAETLVQRVQRVEGDPYAMGSGGKGVGKRPTKGDRGGGGPLKSRRGFGYEVRSNTAIKDLLGMSSS